MTKSKFSASSIVVSATFVIQLENGGQFLNATSISEAALTVIPQITKMKASL